MGRFRLDELLAQQHEEIGQYVLRAVSARRSSADATGAGITGDILPGEIRTANTVLVAEKKAQANVIMPGVRWRPPGAC